MKHRHGDVRMWVLVILVAIAGLTLYRLIPQHGVASGALAAAVIALLILKHLGLLTALGAPTIAFLRARLRRRESDE
jgi:uncharacterized membrane protein